MFELKKIGVLVLENKRNRRLENKKAITVDIIKAAKIYDEFFVGNTFMYVFEGNHIQVTYRSKDFKHLTGVANNDKPTIFFKNARMGKLRHGQIYFDSRHPYNLACKKVSALLNFQSMIKDDLLVLEKITTSTVSYTFGVTDLGFTLCLINPTDRNKNIINKDYYVPQSLRVEDSVSRSKNVYEVNYIFVKKNDARVYSDMIYTDNALRINELPVEIKQRLDKERFGLVEKVS